jgi:Raf kinase inhibitor-like YbhB/YbcL family protein
MFTRWLRALSWVALGACALSAQAQPAKGSTMKLQSTAFAPNGAIPQKHTCEGTDVSPALSWSDVPANAKTLALIVDDPDAPDPKAPKTVWVHWVLIDIPKTATGLPEGGKPLPEGAREGMNDWKASGYRGPCPPIGRHRYYFKLYALDTQLGLKAPTKAELEAAMKGHIVGQAELIGTYEKQKK